MQQIEQIKLDIIPILKQNQVQRASLFGSVLRADFGSASDIDLLVELKQGKSLLDLVALKFKLEEKLGRQVDLLTYNSLHPKISRLIKNSQKRIL